MTFAPVKRTYNDRFFFSSEREEADLSNFELPQVFRASFSTILFLLLLSFRQKKGREFSRKSTAALLLSSRMYRFYFALECRKVRFPSKQEDDFRSLFGQAKIS